MMKDFLDGNNVVRDGEKSVLVRCLEYDYMFGELITKQNDFFLLKKIHWPEKICLMTVKIT